MVAIAMTREMGTLGKDVAAAGIVDVRRILRERVSLNLTGRTGSHILITSPGGPVGSSDPALKWLVSAA